ncbi:CaiB/BaiF CoA-transferase family protein [Pusillimonas sp. ANT_WB101]|uniref:CaiB/BaiF CoA transferase family protein n=1 Tax=Pusillimonas sp. ANT_WB101 TaxID=2597356 RepID=UPI0011ECD6A1|nr:CaiB/BaiF CoA-transferase family protein [Pusillimonas sp. ANT_WB101]KAA0889306.1 CoA transferase [Pusillimonas sp. ANT_WB101]
MNNEASLPLSGVRVLDLSRILAGPWCGMVLADMGAEVIKVEHPTRGDDTRDWGIKIGETETAYYNCVNRNKRSITLDLKTAQGQQIARDLIKESDVVIQNFKFDDVTNMGLDYEQVSKDHPELIYCSVSGYDRKGPEASRPGYDVVIQGEAGLVAINGEADQPPLKFGVAVADLFTGMYSAQAVLAALYERNRTGHGQHVEMALYDCGLMLSSYYGLEALRMGENPQRFGNVHPSIIPYGVYQAKDGQISIAVGNNAQFKRFCLEVIDRPDLAEDERYTTNLSRRKHRETLSVEVNHEVASRTRADLLERLSRVGIPAGEVLGLHEALTSKRTVEAGLIQSMPHPKAGSVDVFAPPYRFKGERLPVRMAPPELGEANDDVLAQLLGLTEQRIQELKTSGVI